VVSADEEISGQVVAVFGSVRVDGKVGDQVVAVFGSVVLGDDAWWAATWFRSADVSFASPGAQTRGGVTEVALTEPWFPFYLRRGTGWEGAPFFMSSARCRA
jgi:hypothetical protein